MGAPVLPVDEKPVKPSLSTPDTHPKKAIVPSNAHHASPSHPALATATCKQKPTHTISHLTSSATVPKQSHAPQPPSNQSSAPKPAPSIRNAPKPAPPKPQTLPVSSKPGSAPSAKLAVPSTKPNPVKPTPASITKPAPKKQPMQISKQEPAVVTAVQPIAKAVPVIQRHITKQPVTTHPSLGPRRAHQNGIQTGLPVKTEQLSVSVKPVTTQPVVKSIPVNTARPVAKAEPQKVTSQSPAKQVVVGAPQPVKTNPMITRTTPASVRKPQLQQPTTVARQVPVKTAPPTTGVSPARTNVQAARIARPAVNGTVRPPAPARTPVTASPPGSKTSTVANTQATTVVRRVPQQTVKSVGPAKASAQSVMRTPGQGVVKQVQALTRQARPVPGGRAQSAVRVAGQPVRTTGQTFVRTGGQPIAQTKPQPIPRTSAQPVARTNAQPVARTNTQPVARTNTQPVARTNTQPIARTNTQAVAQNRQQVVRSGTASVLQVSRQAVARSVVRSTSTPALQAPAQVAPTKAGPTTTVSPNVGHKVASGAQTGVRHVVPQTLPAKPVTAVARQNGARAPQPRASGTQVVARQTAATMSRPAVQTAVRAVVAQTQRTGTQPVARAIPQAIGNTALPRPVSRTVQAGARVVAQGTAGAPTSHVISRTGPTPVRTAVHTAARTVTQPVARAVPHTVQKVIMKPKGAVVSQAPSALTMTRVANVPRNAVTKTQSALAQTAVHPGVVKAVQNAVSRSGQMVRTAGGTNLAKPGVQMQGRSTLGVQAQARSTATTSATRPVVQRPLQTATVRSAGTQLMRTATPTRQVAAQPHCSVVKSVVQVGNTTPAKTSVTTTTPVRTVTPQKRPPPVPPEALAAAMAAAAAVEPTPPLEPRTHPSLTAIKPTITAPRIAKAPQPSGLATPTGPAQSVPVFVPKPGAPAPSRPAAVAPKVVQANTTTPTPAATGAETPSRIPKGMTFLPGEHVTIWNRVEKRKIAGNAAPLGKNVEKYLQTHPECDVYVDQDEDRPGSRSNRKRPKYNYHSEQPSAGDHVAIWNRVEHRKIAGNAAPLAKNLQSYLRKNPNCEVYDYQDTKRKPGYRGRRQERHDIGAPIEEPSDYEFVNTPLDAWKDLNSYIDSEVLYKTEYEQTAELLLTHGDDEDDVSPLILTGPLGVEEPHVMIDLDKFINNDEDDVCEPLGDFLDDTLPPLKGSLGIPNSI